MPSSATPESHDAASLPSASTATPPQKLLPAPSRNVGGLLRRAGLIVILLAAGAFAFWRIKGNQAATAADAQRSTQAANRPIPVTVQPVASRTMPIFYTALGTVTPFYAVTIKSRVDGQLLTVPVREGQQVRKGQVLATIDDKPYRAAVAQAEGQLTKDQATAKNTSAEADRYKALFEAGVVSKESQQAQAANSGQSVGTLEQDRAAIQAAKVNVNYARITSPIDGVVGLRQVDPGNIVHANDATGLILVTQLQPITVIFTLPEDQLPVVLKRMRAGQKLSVEAYDRNQSVHLATGTLLTVDNSIDTTTGTLKAKAVFDNHDRALFPNQFVNVRLILEQRQNSLVIPASALQSGSQGNFVYVVKPGMPPRQPDDATADAGKPGSGRGPRTDAASGPPQGQPAPPPAYVDLAPVVVDLTEGSQVILKGGVQPGDMVVVDGQEKLKRFGRVIAKEGAPSRNGSAAVSGGGIGNSPGQSPGTKPADINGAPVQAPGAGSGMEPGTPGTQRPRGTNPDGTRTSPRVGDARAFSRHGG